LYIETGPNPGLLSQSSEIPEGVYFQIQITANNTGNETVELTGGQFFLYDINNKKHKAKFIGIEIADGFEQDLKDRKKELNAAGFNNVEFIMKDIRRYQITNANLITSIFTLQFMPKRDRKQVISGIYSGLNDGGAFIFAEKTICESAMVQDMITFNYYDYKRKSFDTEDIMDKERTLRNIMKPLTWKQLELMVSFAGFTTVQPFWRNHSFVGALAIK